MGIGTPSIHNKIPRPITVSLRQHCRVVVVMRGARKRSARCADELINRRYGYFKSTRASCLLSPRGPSNIKNTARQIIPHHPRG
jgi:hypothetical protein